MKPFSELLDEYIEARFQWREMTMVGGRYESQPESSKILYRNKVQDLLKEIETRTHNI